MGQTEVREAIIRLNDRLNKPVTKIEIAAETGYNIGCVTRSLLKLKQWNEVDVRQAKQSKKCMYLYSVPQHIREKYSESAG